MNSNKNNFIYNHYDLSDISFNPSKKWGMANIPHNGRLNIELRNGKSREFILLGAQEETEIIQRFNEMYKR
ncbi:hypothetical protein ACFO9Q_20095 [Paenibacillus sp. GCM10023252]|uniref:hypothetical protein n=1 Tax=Paenibacillus sp. GCM10023252 TaxID=3252649 RepID=UPI00360C10C0